MITIEHTRWGINFPIECKDYTDKQLLYACGDIKPNYPIPAIPLHLEFVSNTISGVYGSGLFSPDNLECYALWFKD